MSKLLPGIAAVTALGVYQAARTAYGHRIPPHSGRGDIDKYIEAENIYKQYIKANNQNISNPQLKQLMVLFKLSYHHHIDIGTWFISQYEQHCIEQTKNIQSINEFVEYIQISSKITEITTYNTKDIKSMLINYAYLHSSIYKPLSIKSNVTTICDMYEINIIISYITHLNVAIHELYKRKQQNELQFNIKFVPRALECLFASNEECSKTDNISRNKSGKNIFDELDEMINCADIACYINITIIRKNKENMDQDVIYLSTKSKPVKSHLSEYDSLIKKMHSTPNMERILTFSYDLCSLFERTYCYYDGFGTRVFKENMLKVLGLLFGVDIRSQIDGQVVDEFNAKYKQLTDPQNSKCLELFSVNNKTKNDDDDDDDDEKEEHFVGYKICDEYVVNDKIIFIPRKYTEKAMKNDYILERFRSKEQLFYYLRWRCVMDAAHHNLKIFNANFIDGIAEILIFCTDLHEKNGRKVIYVIGNRNDKETSKKPNINKKNIERWKMSEYFMTATEIEEKYGINSNDLPFGSNKILKRMYSEMDIDKLINIKNNISINKYKNLSIIKTNKEKKRVNTTRKYAISQSDLFAKIKKSNKFIPIISFIDDKVKYNVDMVLLVDIGDNHWIGIIFRNFEAIGIGIDCIDLCNKMILFEPPNNKKQYFWIQNDYISGLNIIDNNKKDEIIADLMNEIKRLKQERNEKNKEIKKLEIINEQQSDYIVILQKDNVKLCDQNNYYFQQTLNPNCNIKPHPLHLPYSVQAPIAYNIVTDILYLH